MSAAGETHTSSEKPERERNPFISPINSTVGGGLWRGLGTKRFCCDVLKCLLPGKKRFSLCGTGCSCSTNVIKSITKNYQPAKVEVQGVAQHVCKCLIEK